MASKQAFIDFVRQWCEDDSHGYDQSNRWGPDCDCSSLMYMAANAAGYDVPTGSGYTGTMLADFQTAGWTAVPFDGNLSDCEPGCIALNCENHTEAFVDWGTFGGAHIDENGNVAGGASGDQTGNEVSICAAYIPWCGWDYILIPPEDGESGQIGTLGDELTGEGVPQSDSSDTSGEKWPTTPQMPRYRVMTREEGWLDWMQGLSDTGGSSDDYAGIEGHAIYDFDCCNLGSAGWYEIERADGSASRNSSGNINEPITGITVYYDTDTGATGGAYYAAKYQAHWLGDDPAWGRWETDDNDGGAGRDAQSPLDMFRLTLEEV